MCEPEGEETDDPRAVHLHTSDIIVKVTKFLWRTEGRSTKDGNRVVSIENRNENMSTWVQAAPL